MYRLPQSSMIAPILNPEIPIKGFLVIASKKHYRSIEEFSMEEMQDFASLLHESRLLLHKIGINEVTIIQEERSSHFHLWLFPWLDWMVDKFEKKINRTHSGDHELRSRYNEDRGEYTRNHGSC